MTIYDSYKKGEYDAAHKDGLLKDRVYLHCEIYEAFLRFRNHHRYDEALDLTVEAMATSHATVKRAISFAKAEKGSSK